MSEPSFANGAGDASWDVSRMVSELRALRASAARTQGAAALPSREALVAIVAGLRAAFFPAHFGPPDLTEQGTDFFVGHTLDATLRSLQEQVRRALSFDAEHRAPRAESAASLIRAFASRLPRVCTLIETDVRAAFEGDPAAKTVHETIFCYPGVTAITHHRLAHELYALGVPLLARIISEIAHAATGIDIHPGAEIGSSFFIDHGTGVVIGETARLGERVRLYQGVTLGAKSFPVDEHGQPIKGIPRHPIVEDDVVIYAGATVLGRITIGSGSMIGGNVWLTRSVPPGSRITQAQVRSEAFDDGAGI